MYEAYGNNNITFDAVNEYIYIDGKRLVNSDNFGTKIGYGIQVNGNLRLFKQNFVKALANVGYTQMESTKYPSPDGFSHGVRINVFSLGLGLQVNPVGIHKFYPSLIELFRFNEIGAESFHKAGVDFLIVSPRFGYTTGITLNYKFNKKLGISFGTFYNYDNWLNKSSSEGEIYDPYGHVRNFRDEASPTNGLSLNRRIVYFSYNTGINIYFK